MIIAMHAAQASEAVVTAAVGSGVTITSADERFSMNLRGRVQLRETLVVGAPEGEVPRELASQAQVQTARLTLRGHTLSEDLRYTVQLAFSQRDYRDGTVSPLYDAYLDAAASRDLSVRVGQMFVPFDRLRTIREFALQLPDRPRVVSELTLDRDVGVVASSDHLGGDRSVLAYRLGAFGGGGPNTAAPRELGGLLVGRVELRPLGPLDDDSEGDLERRRAPGLALGMGAAYNVNASRVRSTTSTVFEGGTVDYLHLCGDAVFKVRGFAVASEVVLRDAADDRIVSIDDAGTARVEYARSGWGVVVQPSMMLTPR
ncbi:MAG: porin, partial [Alphaproteobacteria bacterium]|nr:porin [Alphaproteobacteria bacterium]MCB9700236.1 porin [Alphaproteobacteria bacterium]